MTTTTTTTTRTTLTTLTKLDDPARWHRVLCPVGDRLIVTGDLDADTARALDQLGDWVDAGVTAIVDVRGEWSDEALVAANAPGLDYIWAGTHDGGFAQSDGWFDAVLARLRPHLDDPTGVVLTHCHMGVNRGPSMALRILLELGWDALDALEAIRAARPIAATIYAADAVDHFHRRQGSSTTVRVADVRRVARWLETHPIDVAWIVSRIRRAA
jgi:hypothetical protein